MAALGATMTIAGAAGERTVAAEEFFLGVYMTAVAPDELLTKITIPAADGAGDGFAAVTIGKDGTCIANAAATVGDGQARIALGCVAAMPVVRELGRRGRRGRGGGPGRRPRPARRRARVGRLSPPPGRGPRGPRRAAGKEELMEPISAQRITVSVNGESHEREVEARRLLVHFLRDDLDLTGTHVGCDTGNCGACTVIYDGTRDQELHDARRPGGRRGDRDGRGAGAPTATSIRSRRPSRATHALQCGYCTPGMLMSAKHLLEHNPEPTETEIRRAIQGNICRCTGYVNIVEAVQAAAQGGGRHVSETTVATGQPLTVEEHGGQAGLHRRRTCRARRTGGSCRARACSSTTSSATAWRTCTSCARRTRTRRSRGSTSRRRPSSRACTER